MPTLEALILESGAMTPAQIAAVKEEQRLRGGSLDANILALGYLTEPALQRILLSLWPHPPGVRYDLPPTPRALALLSREDAASLRAVPQSLQGNQLTVLVCESDVCEALSKLDSLAAYDLVCVATNEVRLCHYLEQHYQVECSPRYRQIMKRIQETERASPPPAPDAFIGDPMAGLEQEDYLAGAVVAGPAVAAPVELLQGDIDPDMIPLLEDELLVEVEEDGEEAPAADATEGQQALREAHEELASEDFQAALDAVSSMEAIPDVFFRFGASSFKSVALFKVQSQMIMGWKGAGLGMVSERIRGIVVPVQSDTFLVRGIQENPYVGPAGTNPVEERIAEQLGATGDAYVATAAVSVGERPVLVVCGLCEQEPPAPEVATELAQLCTLASGTVVRLILERKKAKKAAQSAPRRENVPARTGTQAADEPEESTAAQATREAQATEKGARKRTSKKSSRKKNRSS